MDYLQMIETLSAETYHSLRRSVEIGKWPDGTALTAQQRESAMQAIIAWGEQHLGREQRVGYIDKGHKAGDTCAEPVELPLNWKE